MQATVSGGATLGIQGVVVAVEVDVANGLPNFLIVGLPDAAVNESKERVRAALRNSGFDPPGTRITVNLAPAHLRKAGPGFDLPIAIGLLAAADSLGAGDLGRYVFLGELALDGSVRRVAGVLPVAIEARRWGQALVVARPAAPEALLVGGLDVFAFETLQEVVAFLREPAAVRPAEQVASDAAAEPPGMEADLADIKGQPGARRAVEIAAAGGHNLLFIGPPGSGKSMLARRIPSILPPLTPPEALEVTAIYSVGGLLESRGVLESRPPFRSPHHSISCAGLVGGSSAPRPGEVSLAHRGVLFLDELGEFSRGTLEVLRQPLEDRRVVISRARATVAYPADFSLAAAMNPCPCGYSGDRVKTCTCGVDRVARYWSRISGPLVDRLDLHIEVPRLEAEQIMAAPQGEPSAVVRERVREARARQGRRFQGRGGRIVCNGQMVGRELRQHCRLDAASERVLAGAIRQLGLTARTYDRVLKVARTLADLAGRDEIRSDDLKEALQLRVLDAR
ncbi:MAG: YifB family Mg chelatase-like AAA ATPase [Candidatus Sericytochromatia bacterium]|nr:YifB family Mg chelatase-like AAA ATPase [Candidatus Tanganyikabacteria bacterium]